MICSISQEMECPTHVEEASQAQRGRPFEPGRSGNPAGRPKGARNKATLIAEAQAEEKVQAMLDKLAERAMEGNVPALRAWLDRTRPQQRDCYVFDLPDMHSIDDVPAATAALMDAVKTGKISPREAERVEGMIIRHGAQLDKAASRAAQAEIMARVKHEKEQRETAERGRQAERERLRQEELEQQERERQRVDEIERQIDVAMAARQAELAEIKCEIQRPEPGIAEQPAWPEPPESPAAAPVFHETVAPPPYVDMSGQAAIRRLRAAQARRSNNPW